LIYLAVADLPKLGAYFKKEGVMRIGAFVMAGLLALAVSTPASAATKKKPLAPTVNNFETCEKKASKQPLHRIGRRVTLARASKKAPASAGASVPATFHDGL
jgi:hypothetical protein